MLVIPASEGLRLVTQPDHAFAAADILSLWRGHGLEEHPRRGDLLFAAREHDNGWREADAAPRVDPATRRPYPFTALPDDDRRELWWRGVRRFPEERPWAGLLIVEHALRIHRERTGPEWPTFLEGLTALREEILEGHVGTARRDSPDRADAERALEADYRWLDLVDALSLAGCGAIETVEKPGYRADYRAESDGGELRVEPFPLTGATRFRVACRTIPDRDYAGDADLGGELAAARWGETVFRLVPTP